MARSTQLSLLLLTPHLSAKSQAASPTFLLTPGPRSPHHQASPRGRHTHASRCMRTKGTPALTSNPPVPRGRAPCSHSCQNLSHQSLVLASFPLSSLSLLPTPLLMLQGDPPPPRPNLAFFSGTWRQSRPPCSVFRLTPVQPIL